MFTHNNTNIFTHTHSRIHISICNIYHIHTFLKYTHLHSFTHFFTHIHICTFTFICVFTRVPIHPLTPIWTFIFAHSFICLLTHSHAHLHFHSHLSEHFVDIAMSSHHWIGTPNSNYFLDLSTGLQCCGTSTNWETFRLWYLLPFFLNPNSKYHILFEVEHTS